jgi:hypothetical protein
MNELPAMDQANAQQLFETLTQTYPAPDHAGGTVSVEDLFINNEINGVSLQIADQLLAQGFSISELQQLEQLARLPENKGLLAIEAHCAITYAISKLQVRNMALHIPEGKQVTIRIAIPAYREFQRLLPRGEAEGASPVGEHALQTKINQLNWLFGELTDKFAVEIVVVDDQSDSHNTEGDPVFSDFLQQHLATLNTQGIKVSVSSVTEVALDENTKNTPLRHLQEPKAPHQRRGAAYWTAIQQAAQDSVVQPANETFLFLTDTDLSMPVAQLGNLLEPVLMGDASVAQGSRRLPTSYFSTNRASGSLSPNLARAFRQPFFGSLIPADTQCGATVMRISTAAEIIGGIGVIEPNMMDQTAPVAMLSQVVKMHGSEAIAPVPVVWIDSSSASTISGIYRMALMSNTLAFREILGPIEQPTPTQAMIIEIINLIRQPAEHIAWTGNVYNDYSKLRSQIFNVWFRNIEEALNTNEDYRHFFQEGGMLTYFANGTEMPVIYFEFLRAELLKAIAEVMDESS